MSEPKVKLVTEFVYPPIPIRSCDWSAHDSNTYDGAPDSSRRQRIVGWGATEQEAIEDFWQQWNELDAEETIEIIGDAMYQCLRCRRESKGSDCNNLQCPFCGGSMVEKGSYETHKTDQPAQPVRRS